MTQLFLSTQPTLLAHAGLSVATATPVSAVGPSLVRSEHSLDDMEIGLSERFGPRHVCRLSRDVLTYSGGGMRQVLQRVPSQGEQPVFDFSSLAASHVFAAPPIIFYRPGVRADNVSFSGWIGAMRAFGYDIQVVSERGAFQRMLGEEGPEIVCVSAYETQIGEVAHAYRDLMELCPEAVTILGGYAALPAASRFFDIVAPGEGDLVLPLLLKHLRAAVLFGDSSTPEGRNAGAGPRHASEQNNAALREIRGRRIAVRGHGLAEIPVDIGAQLLLWPEGQKTEPAHFPAGPRASWPIPISGVELATMFLMPSLDWKDTDHARIYAQRGCPRKVEERCGFCSVTNPPGRRMSIPDVLAMIKDLSERFMTPIVLNDEDFLQNRSWVTRILDGIEALHLPGRTRIIVQTRADRWSEDLVLRMWDLGMQIDVGLETLHPARAERLGKARPGEGEGYVERGRALIELASRYARDRKRDSHELLQVYMMCAARGDSIRNVLEDLILQLRFLKRLKEEGCPEPRLSYTLEQLPLRMSRDVREALPDARALDETRASAIDLRETDGRLVAHLGPIEGTFHPFSALGDGELVGMIEGRRFRHERSIENFVAGVRRELVELWRRIDAYGEADAFASVTTFDFFGAALSALIGLFSKDPTSFQDQVELLVIAEAYTDLFKAAFLDEQDEAGEGSG